MIFRAAAEDVEGAMGAIALPLRARQAGKTFKTSWYCLIPN